MNRPEVVLNGKSMRGREKKIKVKNTPDVPYTVRDQTEEATNLTNCQTHRYQQMDVLTPL